ncbi:uncharacterized protein LOC126743125 isoform X2 [Anthonomus grandis grandis]|uniref:uncharacterized protein LOC126743125 isoform X2 n=1 Tax=Anthonomus grandis grandis TaxID=2921223 RepID=UPI0021656A61|nr:uncharacterized protein LOC126743125 isoform X2 [Anthonomus grandis grandis]
MKVAIALAIFVVVTAVAALDKEQVQQKMKAASEKCLNDPAVGVSKEALNTYRESKGTGPKPANLEKLSICVLKENGWMNNDNSLNTAEIKQILELGTHDHPEKLDEIMAKCTADKGSSEETANNLLECLVRLRGHQ